MKVFLHMGGCMSATGILIFWYCCDHGFLVMYHCDGYTYQLCVKLAHDVIKVYQVTLKVTFIGNLYCYFI